MIKRLIFDIDNTLILWKDEYYNKINETLDEIKYPRTKTLYKEIQNAQMEYEKDRKSFKKIEILDYINKRLDLHLPEYFMDLLLKKYNTCVPRKLEFEDYKTLEYLHNKYELVALTNWFKDAQIERMKNVDIYKYFKEVYGAENYAKPFKESFIQASKPYELSECAMIGDSIETDIKGAKNAGIKTVVWRDNNSKKEEYADVLEKVFIIKELKQLKDIF